MCSWAVYRVFVIIRLVSYISSIVVSVGQVHIWASVSLLRFRSPFWHLPLFTNHDQKLKPKSTCATTITLRALPTTWHNCSRIRSNWQLFPTYSYTWRGFLTTVRHYFFKICLPYFDSLQFGEIFWPRFSFCLRSFWKGFDTPEFPEFFGKIRFFKICLLLENFVDSFQFGEFSFELDRDLVFCLRCFCQVFLKGVRNPQIPSIFYKTLGNHIGDGNLFLCTHWQQRIFP